MSLKDFELMFKIKAYLYNTISGKYYMTLVKHLLTFRLEGRKFKIVTFFAAKMAQGHGPADK